MAQLLAVHGFASQWITQAQESPAVIDTHVHILFKIVLLRILEGFVWSLVPTGVTFQSIMHT